MKESRDKQPETKSENPIANLVRKGSDATPEVNEALLQKLMEIDKAVKQKDKDKNEIDAKLMPPPTMSRGLASSSQSTSELRSRSLQPDPKNKTSEGKQKKLTRANSFGSTGSLNEAGIQSSSTLPASFQRGNRVSKSARTFGGKISDAGQRPLTSSAKNSPTPLRKQSSADADKVSRPGSG